MDDLISRQAAIDAIHNADTQIYEGEVAVGRRIYMAKEECCEIIDSLPSAQTERDIPVKPTETTDHAWGILKRQAVCPKCDYYLGNVAFLGDYKGKKITYCETCGQAIDWEGWDFDCE